MPDKAPPAIAGLKRRDFLKYAGAALTLLVSPAGFAAATSILAVRIWPARDYTRITLEYQQPLAFTHMVVKNPERLVIDLEGVEFNSILQSLPGRISETDPYIRLIRAGRHKPGVVRLVVELKSEIKPEVFTLKPVGEYGHRLVMDLYPAEPVDPLVSLLEKLEQKEIRSVEKPEPQQKGREEGKPEVSRLVTIVLDPGHGGEDPGAIGRGGSHEKNVTLQVARRLKSKIDAEPNMRSMLTRDGDFFIPLHHRVQKARRVQADLFVSVHADAFIKPTARGSSVFVLSENGAT
ncbi:MAG: N-acetylmuramoyl-L-alanine amidase, partial [Rhodocyclaceae bacterium]|nr:N-acetylmuramoyl-L-alanine amidase [Rhodocyclaceae bacterium]